MQSGSRSGGRGGRGKNLSVLPAAPSAISLASSSAHVSLPSTNLMVQTRAGLVLLSCTHLGVGSAPSHHPPGQPAMLLEALPRLHGHDARTGPLDLLTTPRVSHCPLSFTHAPLRTRACGFRSSQCVSSPKGTSQRPAELCDCHQGFSGPLPACAHLGGPARLGKAAPGDWPCSRKPTEGLCSPKRPCFLLDRRCPSQLFPEEVGVSLSTRER